MAAMTIPATSRAAVPVQKPMTAMVPPINIDTSARISRTMHPIIGALGVVGVVGGSVVVGGLVGVVVAVQGGTVTVMASLAVGVGQPGVARLTLTVYVPGAGNWS